MAINLSVNVGLVASNEAPADKRKRMYLSNPSTLYELEARLAVVLVNVLAGFETVGIKLIGYRVAIVDVDEPTFVADAIYEGGSKALLDVLKVVSSYLAQDCIAVKLWDNDFNGTYSGHLVGERCAAWGEYNPDLFIQYKERY